MKFVQHLQHTSYCFAHPQTIILDQNGGMMDLKTSATKYLSNNNINKKTYICYGRSIKSAAQHHLLLLMLYRWHESRRPGWCTLIALTCSWKDLANSLCHDNICYTTPPSMLFLQCIEQTSTLPKTLFGFLSSISGVSIWAGFSSRLAKHCQICWKMKNTKEVRRMFVEEPAGDLSSWFVEPKNLFELFSF